MNTQTRHSLVIPIAIFIALAIVDMVLIAATRLIVDPLSQIVLISTGSVIFGSGLVFFLMRIGASQDKK
jgi:predicted membrane channel-forming protein YqfA (hemolysin III family)